jgi:hypothetical protein
MLLPPIVDVLPGDEVVFVTRFVAVEEFEQYPVVEYTKLYSCITGNKSDLRIVRDRLLVLPDFINNVLESFR